MGTEVQKIPTLQELVESTETDLKENALMVILNQEPPKGWVERHPFVKIKDASGADVQMPYIPVSRIEYLLTRIYTKWWVEIKNVTCIANSCVVTVRLYVVNPITRETEWNDGVGACPIQTEKGAGAMDWNKAKSAGVQMAAPAAETYAFKDAAEKFGKLFGKDLSRKDMINYTELLKPNGQVDYDDLSELYELKKGALNTQESKDAKRILDGKEVKSYHKLKTLLMSK